MKESTERARAASVGTQYDALAAQYAAHLSRELESKPFDRAFLERFAALARRGRVLDLCCGPGHVGRHLAGLGCEVHGLDLSARMVEIARERNPEMHFVQGDMRALPHRRASLTGIVAFYAIVHLQGDDLITALTEVRRTLVPGGVLALAFHAGHETVHVEELWGVKTKLDFVFCEPAAVTSTLMSLGFEIVESSIRAPYAPAVEAQTERCYLIAQSAPEARA